MNLEPLGTRRVVTPLHHGGSCCFLEICSCDSRKLAERGYMYFTMQHQFLYWRVVWVIKGAKSSSMETKVLYDGVYSFNSLSPWKFSCFFDLC